MGNTLSIFENLDGNINLSKYVKRRCSPAMTERCQTKFTEKFDNFNYIIYLGILCTSVAVLVLYRYVTHPGIFLRAQFRAKQVTHFCFGCRFHFTAIGFCYGLGCLACFYGINSSILVEYVEKIKVHFLGHSAGKKLEQAPKKVSLTVACLFSGLASAKSCRYIP